MITLTESGMVFGPFDEKRFYHLEKCNLLSSFLNSIKIAEFAVALGSDPIIDIHIIEAKSTSPNSSKSKEDYERFISEICEKAINSTSLLIAASAKRHSTNLDDFPENFASLNLSDTNFKFVLVFPNHPKEELVPIRDKLKARLLGFQKALGLSSDFVSVMNAELAMRFSIVSELSPAPTHSL